MLILKVAQNIGKGEGISTFNTNNAVVDWVNPKPGIHKLRKIEEMASLIHQCRFRGRQILVIITVHGSLLKGSLVGGLF